MQPLKNGDCLQFLGNNSSLGLDRDLGFAWLALVTSLIFLYHLTKKLPNQILCNLLKIVIFRSSLAITPVWDLIETWVFRVDDPCDFPDIPISSHKKITTPNITQPLKNK